MNPIQSARALWLWNKIPFILKENAPMKLKLTQLLALVGSLSAAIGLPEILTKWVHAHLGVYMGVVAAAILLHSLMPSVFAAPSDAEKKAAGLGILLLCMFLATPAQAQTQATPQNFYAGGLSYAVSGSPSVAGTGLYARSISDSGTYAFSVFDAIPNTLKPLTVTSNVGVGIAQKAITLGKVDIFVPTAAGISWTGSNTGWQWNTGAIAAINYKGWKLMPNVRVFKSSVSNGTGYQLIPGFLVGKNF